MAASLPVWDYQQNVALSQEKIDLHAAFLFSLVTQLPVAIWENLNILIGIVSGVGFRWWNTGHIFVHNDISLLVLDVGWSYKIFQLACPISKCKFNTQSVVQNRKARGSVQYLSE